MRESSRREGQGTQLPGASLDAPATAPRDPAQPATSRRRFLLALGASSAAAVGGGATAAATTGASAPATGAAAGYRETDHVRRYYASARN
jgi:hypothetical protein